MRGCLGGLDHRQHFLSRFLLSLAASSSCTRNRTAQRRPGEEWDARRRGAATAAVQRIKLTRHLANFPCPCACVSLARPQWLGKQRKHGSDGSQHLRASLGFCSAGFPRALILRIALPDGSHHSVRSDRHLLQVSNALLLGFLGSLPLFPPLLGPLFCLDPFLRGDQHGEARTELTRAAALELELGGGGGGGGGDSGSLSLSGRARGCGAGSATSCQMRPDKTHRAEVMTHQDCSELVQARSAAWKPREHHRGRCERCDAILAHLRLLTGFLLDLSERGLHLWGRRTSADRNCCTKIGAQG